MYEYKMLKLIIYLHKKVSFDLLRARRQHENLEIIFHLVTVA